MKSTKLKLLTTKIGSGITPRGGSSVYVNQGTNLIRSQNIYNDGFEKDGLVCIDDQTAQKMKGVEVKENDVLINITGDSVARTLIVPKQFLPARVNQHVSIIRTNSELNPYFLYYFLIDESTQNHLLQLAGGGGTRNALTKEMLENLEISYPEEKMQDKIVSKLNQIKNLIEIKRKQNQIQEKIIQSVFRSWFIDFNGQTAFVDSELGEIPKGWNIDTLENICSIIYRYPEFYGMEKFDRGVPVIRGEHITNTGFLSLNFSDYWFVTEEFSKKFPKTILEFNDVVITVRGTVGKIGIVSSQHVNAQISPNCIRLNSNYSKIKPVFFYYSIKQKSFTDLLQGSVSTSAVPGITAEAIKNMKIIVPPEIIQNKFELISSNILSQIDKNRISIVNLTNIQNSILPKLMSGEIRI